MNLFTNPIFTEGVLPFLLVFVLIFAILQKSQILGEKKSQIDALVSLAIALLLIGMPTPRDYIVSMVPWLAVALVVLLIFMLIFGFVGELDDKKNLKFPSWVRPTVLGLAVVFVVVLVLKVTGNWDTVWGWFDWDSGSLGTILILAAIGLGLWVALGGKKSNPNG